MGLDIRQPIGLLFAAIAAELLAYEGFKIAGGSVGPASPVNIWCALFFGLFGLLFLWLSRRGKAKPRP
jgi:hypothetical protein